MAETVFLVGVDAPREEVHDALTTRDGIEAWWTSDVEMGSDVGERMSLGFPDAPMRFTLRVDVNDQQRVQWTSVGEFPPHWVDTEISFSLSDAEESDGTQVFFEHKGFTAADPMLGHSAFVWAGLMNSLRQYCETGQGSPIG